MTKAPLYPFRLRLILSALMLCAFTGSGAALAQEVSCAFNRTEIGTIRADAERARAYTNTILTRYFPARLETLAPLEDGSLLMGGAKDGRGWLLTFDARGREAGEWTAPEAGEENKDAITAVAALDRGGKAVLLDYTFAGQEGLAFAMLGKDGAPGALTPLIEKGARLYAQGLSASGGGYIVLAAAVPEKGAQYPILWKIGKDGGIVWERRLRMGASGALTAFAVTPGDGLIAAGWLESAGARQQGWLVRFDSGGRLMWQRTFSRGGEATLDAAAPVGSGYYALGRAEGADGAAQAGWLLRVDGSGGQVWERFYQEEKGRPYYPAGLAALPDGRAAAFWNGRGGNDSSSGDFLQYAAISPRGELLETRRYMAGPGSDIAFVTQGSENGFYAAGRVDYAPPGVEKAGTAGWLLQVPEAKSYATSCPPLD